jgi:hypothetical protein
MTLAKLHKQTQKNAEVSTKEKRTEKVKITE